MYCKCLHNNFLETSQTLKVQIVFNFFFFFFFQLLFARATIMKWFILLSLFVSGSLGAKLLGSEKCTWGPSYWCSGLAQSAGCRVIFFYFNTCILQWKPLNVIINTSILDENEEVMLAYCKPLIKQPIRF